MKGYIIAAAAAAVLCCLASCSGKVGSDNGSSSAPVSATDAVTTDTADNSAVTSTSSGKQTTAASTTVTAAASTKAAQPGVFVYDNGGAIKFDAPASEQSDSTLTEAAQALYESACSAEWNFTVGSPYTLDTADYITGQYDWQYFRVTSEGINSMSDVRADYNKVFSSRYPDDLDKIFMEKDGHVYALNGARGQDIFYDYSQVTGIEKRTDDEIFFTVTSYYSGSPKAPDTPCTVEDEFSAVIDPDGIMRAGKFTLPY